MLKIAEAYVISHLYENRKLDQAYIGESENLHVTFERDIHFA